MPPARPLAAPYSNHRALPLEVDPGISLGPQSTAQVWLLESQAPEWGITESESEWVWKAGAYMRRRRCLAN